MEDEIDLRVYINVLIRHVWLILGLAVIAGAAAFGISSLLPKSYQATAIAVVTRPLYQFQFSSAIQNLPENVASQVLSSKAALELATSDAMLQQLLNKESNLLAPEDRSLDSLRGMLKATAGGDGSIVRLTVTHRNPQQASVLANEWAALYVQQVNDLYGQAADQEKFFESQVVQARSELDRADQALIDFQKRNDAAILQAQLSTKQAALMNSYNMDDSLRLLLQNVTNLQAQLARQPADAQSELGNNLAALLLQINAFNSKSVNAQPFNQPASSQDPKSDNQSVTLPMQFQFADNSVPIQLQLPITGALSNKTAGQQAAYLGDLAGTIEAKRAEITKQAESLPAEIMALQGKIEEARVETAQLTRQRDLARNTYTALSQKVDETRIAVQDTTGRIRLASSASIPQKPLASRFKNTLIGGALGLLVGVIAAFVVEYWRSVPATRSDARQAAASSSH